MDKRFLDNVADKLDKVQFLSGELYKGSQEERDEAKADYEEACSDLERTLFEWVEGQITDPEPAVADKAGELGLLLVDVGNYLLDCSKNWRR